MFKIAICDDDKDAITQLTNLLDEYKKINNITLTYETFTNAFNFLDIAKNKQTYDIYLLDILMPGFTGIDAAKEIHEFDNNANIIFCTSSPEFAISSYSVRATAYLLKPIKKETLFNELNYTFKKLKNTSDNEYVIVKTGSELKKLFLKDIIYVDILGRNTTYHLFDREIISMESFTKISSFLSEHPNFKKAHRSYVVNLDYITSIKETEITFINDLSIFFSKRKVAEFKQIYLNYQMEV